MDPLKKKPVIDESNLLNDGKPQLYQKLHQAYLLCLNNLSLFLNKNIAVSSYFTRKKR